MSTLELDVGDLRPSSVAFTATELVVTLADGRRIATPLDWYPRLKGATAAQRANLEIGALGVHWPDIDEDLSVAGMLKGGIADDEVLPIRSEKPQRESLVSIDIGAKASFEVKTEIPSESAGNFVNALVDIIRPFTEARGLKADLIRVQREEVALRVAEIARKRLELSARKTNPVPQKALIQLLEKASWEESSSELVEKWGHLLASAATDFEADVLFFINTLSEIGPAEAAVLDNLHSRDVVSRQELHDILEKRLADRYDIVVSNFDRPDGFSNISAEFSDLPVDCFRFTKTIDYQMQKTTQVWRENWDTEQLKYELLRARALIENNYVLSPYDSEREYIGVAYYELASLGRRLMGRVS